MSLIIILVIYDICDTNDKIRHSPIPIKTKKIKPSVVKYVSLD